MNLPSPPSQSLHPSLPVLLVHFCVGLVVVDDAQEYLTRQRYQSALGDCLHRYLSGFFGDESQLTEVVTFFVVLVESVLFAVFCC